MTELETLLRRAEAVTAGHGANTTYPSRSAAQRVRELIADLAAALARCDGCNGARAPAAAAAPASAAAAIELAYGLLWHCPGDNRTWHGMAMRQARQELLTQLNHDGQARGISAARELLESRKNSRTKPDPLLNYLNKRRF